MCDGFEHFCAFNGSCCPNYTVRHTCRAICTATFTVSVGTRDENWTGLGVDWIRTIAHFVEFGLDLDCKILQNLGSGLDLDLDNGKEMRHFCCEKATFFTY